MKSIADLLQLYGGWGVATVAIFGIVWMARYIAKLHAERRLDDREMVAAMKGVELSLKNIHAELKEWRQR